MTDQPTAPPFAFAELSPVAFLERAEASFGPRTAVVDGQVRHSYAEFADRCWRLVSALAAQGVSAGDRVGALCSNSHVMLELHHGVPSRGAVLVPVNTRLSAAEMAEILRHAGVSLLVATSEHGERAALLAESLGLPVVIAGGDADTYEAWLPERADLSDRVPVSERSLLAINYTSGTTGTPKGVMYHHRGAYLQALAMAYHASLGVGSKYLWTLPMFHCNGWCFTWALTAAGGVNVCLRSVDPEVIWTLLREEGVTHFSAAPTVLT
ncbi:MAG: AMP-binding protein, partial [Nocardioidaceae bacterium]